jgi:hypothetical protein
LYKQIKLKRTCIFIFFFLFLFSAATAQSNFSLATDVAYLRNFKKHQRFGSIGQTIQFQYHVTTRESFFAWMSYYQKGNYENTLTAAAKLPATNPQQLSFSNKARMGFQQYSLGWKHYFAGGSEGDSINWSIYGLAGFGLIAGTITNTYIAFPDTSLYAAPANPLNGEGKFKRLTLDIGAGWEKPLSDRIFLYGEARVWIPASSYPSPYLFVNKNAPFAGTVNLGIRVLFADYKED